MVRQAHHVLSWSKDTTATFTLSPEPRASLCCAHSAGSGHPERSRRVLTYPETGPCMSFLFVGSQLCTRGCRSFWSLSPAARLSLCSSPSDDASRQRPCLRLVFLQCLTTLQGLHTGDFHPISSRPCRAYTRQINSDANSAALHLHRLFAALAVKNIIEKSL